MPDLLLLSVGVVLNLLVISAPLAFADVQFSEYLQRPITGLYYFLMAMFCYVEGKASLHIPYGKSSIPEKAILPYAVGVGVVSIFWLSLFEYSKYYQPQFIQSIIGAVLILCGIALRSVSIKKLNQYFLNHVSHIDGHQLVTTGIYSVVRHPSELGLLSICFGVVTLLSSKLGLSVIFLVLLPLILNRISLEDKLLLRLFANGFEKYKVNTPSLIPKLANVRMLFAD